MWSFARVELGMSKDEFFSLTLRQWNELVERHRHQLRRRDEMLEFMVAQLIAKVHNVSMGGWKHPIKPEDVMPSQWAREARAKQAKPSRKRQRLVCDQFRTILKMHNVVITPGA